jgi:hypothetical protein
LVILALLCRNSLALLWLWFTGLDDDVGSCLFVMLASISKSMNDEDISRYSVWLFFIWTNSKTSRQKAASQSKRALVQIPSTLKNLVFLWLLIELSYIQMLACSSIQIMIPFNTKWSLNNCIAIITYCTVVFIMIV